MKKGKYGLLWFILETDVKFACVISWPPIYNRSGSKQMTISFWFWEHLKYCTRNRGAHFSIFYIMYTFYLPVMRVKINTKSRNDHSLHKLFMFHNLHRKSESWKKANVNLKENRCVKYTTYNKFSIIKLRMRQDRWEVHFANAKKCDFGSLNGLMDD